MGHAGCSEAAPTPTRGPCLARMGGRGLQRPGCESLDGGEWIEPAQLAQNLDDLATIKHWLGYDTALRRTLRPLLETLSGREAVLVDVAAGGADPAAGLSLLAAEAGVSLRTVAIDLHPQVTAEARSRTRGVEGVTIVRGDALRLPLATASADVALCSFTLHHFTWGQAQALLGEMRRVARRGLILADLAHSRLGYWGAWLLFRLWGRRHRLSRHDGLLSMRRAYSFREVRRLAAEAGLRQPVLHRYPFWFMLLAPEAAFDRAPPRG
ncbi:MAG: methyltransferase domain-containing protein [Anaerolineae bacterium]|nr:methyltransferase domain-containing protein [Anaerolineae bacterium]